MANLRSKLIRLAHANPELRGHLLPLLREEPVEHHEFGRTAYQQVSLTTEVHAVVRADGFALKGKKLVFSGTAKILLQTDHKFVEVDEVSYKAEVSVPVTKDSLKVTAKSKLYTLLIQDALKTKGIEDLKHEASELER
jgi:hypothetical protein